MRKTHYWIIAIVAALTGAFVWLPGYVESSMNGVLHKPPYQISTRARDLQSRIPIVDLHADSLLWARDLLVLGARPAGARRARHAWACRYPAPDRRPRGAAGVHRGHQNAARLELPAQRRRFRQPYVALHRRTLAARHLEQPH